MLNTYSFGDVEFDIPESWSVRQVDGTIEVVDDQERGAMHLSILKKSLASSPNETDAKLLIDNFVSNNNLVADDVVKTSLHGGMVRATGRFHANEASDEMPLYWLLGSVVWQDKAVRMSYCTDAPLVELTTLAFEVLISVRRIS